MSLSDWFLPGPVSVFPPLTQKYRDMVGGEGRGNQFMDSVRPIMQFGHESKTLFGACSLEEVTLGVFINWIWWWWKNWLRILVLHSFSRGGADQRTAVRGELNRMSALGLWSKELKECPTYFCNWRLHYKTHSQGGRDRKELVRDWIRKYSLLLP